MQAAKRVLTVGFVAGVAGSALSALKIYNSGAFAPPLLIFLTAMTAEPAVVCLAALCILCERQEDPPPDYEEEAWSPDIELEKLPGGVSRPPQGREA